MKKKIFSICLSVVVLAALIAVLVLGCNGEVDTYELTMAENPAAGGTATDETGESPYEAGDGVSIKAVPADCYRFVNWTATAGEFDDDTAAETTFAMPAQNVIVTANFEAITLGHFKFYDLDDEVTWPPIGREVELVDQFVALNATVQEAIVFGNPADKEHNGELTPMGDPDHHLTLYRLEYEDLPGTWYVEVENQFGESQPLTVSGPWWLAVPTQKEDHEEPECLDHFLVYEVVSAPPVEPVEVELNDQFTQETVTVYEPVLFANPVKKTLDDEVTAIQNPDDHLVFYWIEGASYERTVNVNNQLSEEVQTFDLTNPELMAVPSEKLDWEEPIDHFKCYTLGPNPPIGEVVGLNDQFVDISANVSSASWFCNPAQKWEEPILDEDHHLTIYWLEDVDTQYWGVTVSNQFDPGEPQYLIVSGPVALAVPTHKLLPNPHELPVGLDHYLLYQVFSPDPMELPVMLIDEFGFGEPDYVTVTGAAYFANPVQKTHETTIDIENELAHLVFYKIAYGDVYEPLVVVNNQFGTELPYDVLGPDMLAVPSLKLDVWEPL